MNIGLPADTLPGFARNLSETILLLQQSNKERVTFFFFFFLLRVDFIFNTLIEEKFIILFGSGMLF